MKIASDELPITKAQTLIRYNITDRRLFTLRKDYGLKGLRAGREFQYLPSDIERALNLMYKREVYKVGA